VYLKKQGHHYDATCKLDVLAMCFKMSLAIIKCAWVGLSYAPFGGSNVSYILKISFKDNLKQLSKSNNTLASFNNSKKFNFFR